MNDIRLDKMTLAKIATALLHKEYSEIENFFKQNVNRFPIELLEKLYFEIIRLRIVLQSKIKHKEELLQTHHLYTTPFANRFSIHILALDSLFRNKSMDIETFRFLDIININSINITKKAFMLNKFKYKKVILNLDLSKAQESYIR